MSFKLEEIEKFPYDFLIFSAKLKDLDDEQVVKINSSGKFNSNVDAFPDVLRQVTLVNFDVNSTNFVRVPTDLLSLFPHLTMLRFNCPIKKVCKDDLTVYVNLLDIRFMETDLKELPGDLFNDLENLECVLITNNKHLRTIGKDIFKNMKNLKFSNLKGNLSIDVVYADPEFLSMDQFDESYKHTSKVFTVKELNAIVNGLYASQAMEDVQNLLKVDDFKDFVIKVETEEFKVHKLMLAARSPTLAEMIKNNPDADELILEDIEVQVFKTILNFIYNDDVPDERFLKIFDAAGKLKLNDLKLKIGKILYASVNDENYVEIFLLAVKHNHEELKTISFEKVKKLFPDLKDDLMNDYESLKSFIDGMRSFNEKKKQAEEALKKIQKDLKKMMKK